MPELGSTRDQLKHRLSKPIYSEYVQMAKSSATPKPQPPSVLQMLVKSNATNRSKPGADGEPRQPAERGPTDAPSPSNNCEAQGVPEVSGGVVGPHNSGVASITPTVRKRAREESMSPLTQPSPQRPRRGSIPACTPPPPTQATLNARAQVDPVLSDFLSREREAALGNGKAHLVDLCDAAMDLSDSELAAFLDRWIEQQIQNKGGRKYERREAGGDSYGGLHRGRGSKATLYKKTQDL
nr:unnamed protein product [Callosobruchus analis]